MHQVLVVDDESQLLELLDFGLSREGYSVRTALDGAEGLAKLTERSADAVVTDVVMPGQEGIETVRLIKRDFPEVRIVAMSGAAPVHDMDYLDIASKLGADRVLVKPFKVSDLVAVLREILPEQTQ